MLVQDLDVEAHTLLGGEGVQVAADRVDLPRNRSAERCLVPLKTMCSMKWERPFLCGSSSREPVLIQMPIEIDRICFISSEMTVSPLGNTCRRILRSSSTIKIRAQPSRMRLEQRFSLFSHTRDSLRGGIV